MTDWTWGGAWILGLWKAGPAGWAGRPLRASHGSSHLNCTFPCHKQGDKDKRARTPTLRLPFWEGGAETLRQVDDTAGSFLCPRLHNEGVNLMPAQRGCGPSGGV